MQLVLEKVGGSVTKSVHSDRNSGRDPAKSKKNPTRVSMEVIVTSL